MHVANGMYGLILVEPPEGLPPVDREYYVMQGDFYTVGKYREKGLQPFDMQKAIDENADLRRLQRRRGRRSSATRRCSAKVGEKVRLFVGNGGPNLVCSFHVIGEIFDNVLRRGRRASSQENVQTTLVPAGGSAIVEFKLEVPGDVHHGRPLDLPRVQQGRPRACSKVDGRREQARLLAARRSTRSTSATRRAHGGGDAAAAEAEAGKLTKEQQIAAGKPLFLGTCSTCHQPDGQGLAERVFPPLAKLRLPDGRQEALDRHRARRPQGQSRSTARSTTR